MKKQYLLRLFAPASSVKHEICCPFQWNALCQPEVLWFQKHNHRLCYKHYGRKYTLQEGHCRNTGFLMMKIVGFFGTSMHNYRTTRRHIPEYNCQCKQSKKVIWLRELSDVELVAVGIMNSCHCCRGLQFAVGHSVLGAFTFVKHPPPQKKN